MTTAKPIPDTYPRVSPHLSIAGAAEAIDFYTEVLGASQRGGRFAMPDGSIAHAEIELGGSIIMIGEEVPGRGDPSPRTLGGSAVSLFVYVEDVDDVFRRAVEAGAEGVEPPTDRFYGDRVATIHDPFGHRWNIATHVEDLSPEEMGRRATAAMGG
jgi:PhnB protein